MYSDAQTGVRASVFAINQSSLVRVLKCELEKHATLPAAVLATCVCECLSVTKRGFKRAYKRKIKGAFKKACFHEEF
jgi:hypothetical protein